MEFQISVDGADPAAGTALPPLVEALSTWIRTWGPGAAVTVTVRTPSGEELVLTPDAVGSTEVQRELQREVARLTARLTTEDGPPAEPTTTPPSPVATPPGDSQGPDDNATPTPPDRGIDHHTPPGDSQGPADNAMPAPPDWGIDHHTPPGPVLQPDDDWPRDIQEP